MEKFKEVDQLKRKLDSYRPIPAEKILAVQQKFRIDWTYHSRSIEGATLTLSETAFFLTEGLTSKGKPLAEYLETTNHMEAISYLENLVKGDTELTERVVKDLHAILFEGIDHMYIGSTRKKLEPGNYKYDNNHVLLPDGSIHHFTDHLQVPGEMESLINWYEVSESKLHPIETAAIFHHRLTAIHPFTDGNGRVARLAMNLILLKKGYTPAIIKNEEREDYYNTLRAADGGDDAPFISLAEKEVTNTMTIMINVIEGKDAYSVKDLRRRLDHFSRNLDSLEKDVGKYSKDIEEERLRTLHEIPRRVEKLASDLISDHATDKFELELIHKNRIQRAPTPVLFYQMVKDNTNFQMLFDSVEVRDILRDLFDGDTRLQNEVDSIFQYSDCAYVQRKIRQLARDSDDVLTPLDSLFEGSPKPPWVVFVDLLTEQGTCVGLFLKARRKYVPNAKLLFVAMPTRFTVVLSSYCVIGVLDHDTEKYYSVPNSLKCTMGSTVLADWTQREIDDFFTDSCRTFLDLVERETGLRREQIEEEVKTHKPSTH